VAFFDYQRIRSDSRESAKTLNVDNPLGHATCLCLALWLGKGFFKDPMFPWISDVAGRDYPNSTERAKALFDYAQKRLVRLLQKDIA
jgi:hypothetical protein